MLAKIVMQCEKSSDLTTLKIVQSERAISSKHNQRKGKAGVRWSVQLQAIIRNS